MHAAGDAKVNALIDDHVHSSRLRKTGKPFELISSTSPFVQVPTSSRYKASIAPRETDEVGVHVFSDPLQFVNFRKHLNWLQTAEVEEK